MATKTSQRIFIWFVTILMVAGTVVSFVVMIVASQNDKKDQLAQQDQIDTIRQECTAYQSKVDAQAKQLSGQYYARFAQYKTLPGVFDAAAVTKLQAKDLIVGSGAAVTKDSSFTAYYLGWNPSGKVFDSSLDGSTLKAPLNVSPGNVIEGWTQGVDGMKIGGVRELTIPASLAYKDQAKGEDIPPNTPLKFVIMLIKMPEAIPDPTTIPGAYCAYYLAQ